MATLVQHVAPPERVRANTYPEVNNRIDRHTRQRLEAAAAEGEPALRRRLDDLDREWDIERVLEAEVALMTLTGLALGGAVNRKLLALPAFSLSMMLLHALHGWYPLLPLFRRAGVRTQDEIDRERYALKSLRGDFDGLGNTHASRRAAAAWRAVSL